MSLQEHLVTTGHACNPHGAMQEFAGLHLAASTLHTVHPSKSRAGMQGAGFTANLPAY